jgi:hypothetical protein
MKSKDGVEEDCHEANAAKSPSFTATKLSHPNISRRQPMATLFSSRRKAMAALFSSRRKSMPLFCFQHSHSILATQKIRVLATRDQNPTGCSAAEESTTSHCIRSTLKKAYSETRN